MKKSIKKLLTIGTSAMLMTSLLAAQFVVAQEETESEETSELVSEETETTEERDATESEEESTESESTETETEETTTEATAEQTAFETALNNFRETYPDAQISRIHISEMSEDLWTQFTELFNGDDNTDEVDDAETTEVVEDPANVEESVEVEGDLESVESDLEDEVDNLESDVDEATATTEDEEEVHYEIRIFALDEKTEYEVAYYETGDLIEGDINELDSEDATERLANETFDIEQALSFDEINQAAIDHVGYGEAVEWDLVYNQDEHTNPYWMIQVHEESDEMFGNRNAEVWVDAFTAEVFAASGDDVVDPSAPAEEVADPATEEVIESVEDPALESVEEEVESVE
ncbi:hypothetical protein ACTQ54_01745 [Fundicoccus sp. Sow4_H7]|uniref:hypothetical protein n=1 Tax=Fundicoccus sp. Sow4_H7 TaxID=3438784 RepID=UPI003F8F7094